MKEDKDLNNLELRSNQFSKKSKREFNISELFKKRTRKTYHDLFKDLEITKGQFITLFLILICFASVLTIDIVLSFEPFNTKANLEGNLGGLNTFLTPGFFIVLGIIMGFIIGGFIVDKIQGRRFPVLLKLLFISLLITIGHTLFFRRFGRIVPSILFFGNSFIAGILFMFFITFFLDFTTILERGRVFSYLIICLAFSMGFMLLLVASNLFIILPSLTIFLSFIYLYKNRENEEPYKPIKKEGSKKEINFKIIKYIFLLGFFNLAIGLFIPIGEIETLGASEWSDAQIFIAIIITIIASLITAISVGIIFDFSGRKASIANIVLAISIVNFIRLFDVNIKYFDLAIILAAFLASFMSVPLLMSDITERENLGKILGITFIISLFCVGLGLYIVQVIPLIFNQKYTGDLFLIGVVNFVSIVCLFVLVNTEETLSAKEQNWPDYLLHLFVIHESGILLYEYSFVKENLGESDLISGGFVGLITLLQEITKEKQRLKSIDHGGKRILFGFDSKRTLIFALIITEELIILRNKLFYFIQEIEDKYPTNLEDFSGVNVELWKKRIDPILDKYFKRKYFELIPELK
ncbi:MAG: hypothetical protein ACTSQJ_16825 [Promethearchaeota archaeon]